jgi:membrane protease YdiL (CAAX protease family)
MPQVLDFTFRLLAMALIAGSAAMWILIARRLSRGLPLAPYEPRLPVPWTGVDLAVVGFLLLLFDSLAVRMLASTGDDLKAMSLSQLTLISATRLVWLLFALVYLSRKAGAYADDMGFDLRKLGSDLRLAGAAFLAAILPVYGAQFLITQVFEQPSEHPLKKLVESHPSGESLFWASVAAIGVAPLVEEFFFRVLLQGWMEKKDSQRRERWGKNPDEPAGFLPIAIAGAFFALLHKWPDRIALLVLSLLLGYVYQRTHRIVAPLALHVLINSLAILQMWMTYLAGPPSTGQ